MSWKPKCLYHKVSNNNTCLNMSANTCFVKHRQLYLLTIYRNDGLARRSMVVVYFAWFLSGKQGLIVYLFVFLFQREIFCYGSFD
jgi:hypothetical protein